MQAAGPTSSRSLFVNLVRCRAVFADLIQCRFLRLVVALLLFFALGLFWLDGLV
jgi:hypothetical protein